MGKIIFSKKDDLCFCVVTKRVFFAHANFLFL